MAGGVGLHYDGAGAAMVKVRGEDSAGGTSGSDTEPDDTGFCSDGSTSGWTTMSLSRLGDPHSPTTTSPGGTVEEKQQECPPRRMSPRLLQDQKPPPPPPIAPPTSPPPSLPPLSQPSQLKGSVPKPTVAVSESAMSTSSESGSPASEEPGEAEEAAEVKGPWLPSPPPQPPKPRTAADTGYPLVAKTMAGFPNLQVYRRFSALNHRILLHMQDEILELSAMLDKLDAQSESAARNRRGMQGNPHGEQRLQLLGAIAWKVGQYSTLPCLPTSWITRRKTNACTDQAVKAFQDTLSIPSARRVDVESFRSWLKENDPLVPNESTFLDADEGDLMSLGATPPPVPAAPTAVPPPTPTTAVSQTTPSPAPAPTPTHTLPPPPAKLPEHTNAVTPTTPTIATTACTSVAPPTSSSQTHQRPAKKAAAPTSAVSTLAAAPAKSLLSTSGLQALTIAAILLAPLLQGSAPACCAPPGDKAAAAAKPSFNWGGFLVRTFLWILALMPAVLSSLSERKKSHTQTGKTWWTSFAVVVVALGCGLTLLSIT